MRRERACIQGLVCHYNNDVTHDEHMAILSFIDHVVGGPQAPIDVEADAIIRAFFKRYPDAAYRMTKFAMRLSAQLEKEPTRTRPRGWLAGLIEGRSGLG